LPSPFGLFLTLRGTIAMWNPLPNPISGFATRTRTSAPLQDLSILRDQSPRPDSEPQSLPLQVARSSFAPRSAATILVITRRYGSSFQIRYFLPGSLSF